MKELKEYNRIMPSSQILAFEIDSREKLCQHRQKNSNIDHKNPRDLRQCQFYDNTYDAGLQIEPGIYEMADLKEIEKK